jgi:hypothetical protein
MTQAIIRIRLHDGSVLQHTFAADDMLSTVCDVIIAHIETNYNQIMEESDEPSVKQRYNSGIKLSVPYPRKLYDGQQIKTISLQEAGLLPTASLIVELDESGYRKHIPKPKIQKRDAPTYTLRKDSQQDKNEYMQKQRQKEVEDIERERLEKKRIMDGLRKEIAADKKEREEQRTMMELKREQEQRKEKKRKRSTSLNSRAPIEGNCTITVRTLQGKTHVVNSLKEDDTLQDLYDLLCTKRLILVNDSITFVNTSCMPRKEFDENDFEDITLNDAELVPNGAISVLRGSLKGVVKQGAGSPRKRKSRVKK